MSGFGYVGHKVFAAALFFRQLSCKGEFCSSLVSPQANDSGWTKHVGMASQGVYQDLLSKNEGGERTVPVHTKLQYKGARPVVVRFAEDRTRGSHTGAHN